jgi:putative N6-adenine-specific DNA methylase
LEPVLAEEISRFAVPAAEPGGVAWEGETLMEALLHLATASRVLVRIGEIEARDFATLVAKAKRLPWAQYLAHLTPKFAITCKKCRLFHTGAIAERLVTAMGGITEGRPEVRVVVRGEADRFQVSVDAGGEPMHRRGDRAEQGKAPLRETLAAGIVRLAKWDPATPLVDPTCGAGTIPLEAARMARGRAPGARREFAAQRFAGWDAARWDSLVAAAARAERTPAAPILGRDIDPRAIARAKANAARAGEDWVTWETIAAEKSALPDGPPGLVLGNLPYGERLPAARRLDATLRRLLRPGWRLAILTMGDVPGKWSAVHRLVNGGLRVTLYVT